MREPLRDKNRLEHIIAAIDRTLRFTEDKTLDDLNSDGMCYYAVVKNIEIIGEAAYMLTNEFKDEHPEIPWRYIVKMRHVLVHGYYQINPKEVWIVVKDDLTVLRQQVQNLIDQI